MSSKQTVPHGSWQSPITSAQIIAASIGVVGTDIIDGDYFWQEMRPKEGGRLVTVQRTANGVTTDLTPENFNARTRVHEYGGHAYTVGAGTITDIIE